ncbi:hypothetical protein Poli38472_000758 [Pythium oligandrum]|uniref:Major facilitator superfamily (MFS) profile domain-containing protein n=1 Tax=Pythium oligandrum TaxID=41045 RepID=A0A8K1CD45_PYTOL|nr:hypothetical protein Poli38472_000758 [Pythium oligandrum]|eukprot:TMW60716.1 hypothetical protein Poli38472_000758 [Pythium oligandrum]
MMLVYEISHTHIFAAKHKFAMSAWLQFMIDGGESPRLVPLKLLYLIHYAAFSTQTFLPMYFDTTEHYSKFQIGVLLAIPCVCSIVGPVVWGAAADLLHNQKLVHIVCLVSAALLMFMLQYVESFELMCLMFFLANFQTQPTWSLLDQVAMEMLDSVGGDYGKQRLYGAIGYGIGGYMSGVIAGAVGIKWCFNMVVALSVVSLYILVRHIPSTKRSQTDVDFWGSLKHILQLRDVLTLFVLVLVIGIMAQLIDSFLFLYLFNLAGNNSNLVGIVIAVETTSELPLFFHANKIIDRLGTPKVIFLGIMAYCIRLMTYTMLYNPWLVLPVEILHGVTFGLVWAAFTNYVYQSAPQGTEGTMIGLLAAVQKGVGGGAGTLAGGFIYQEFGPRVMWGSALVFVLPMALIVTITFSFIAKNRRSLVADKLVELEEQPFLKNRSPLYGAIHHLGSSGCLQDLG